jgi:RNA polymerase sigma-70 factor (ECF subfamily)
MKRNDHDLLLSVCADDEKAFRILFKKYREKLFLYLLRITKSKEASEEMVMDVFMKIWQIRGKLHEIEDFPSFIFHVARNKALDFLRLAAKDKVLRTLIWEEIEAVSNQMSDDNLIANQLKEEIETVVGKLSPQRRTVFRLSREHNLSYSQIASHLNLSKSTVKNHMLDSLQFIRHHLSAHLDLITIVFIFFQK